MSDTAARSYARWRDVREPYLARARDASRLTLPSLVPPLGSTPQTHLPTPYQGLGAQGVNSLASKLLVGLFPPTQPFFRLVPTDPEALRAAGEKVQTQVEEGLTRIERVVASEFELLALRPRLFEALKHLLIAGNVVLHMQPDGTSRVLGLEQYVARRDPMGMLECLIVREDLDRETLTEEQRAMVRPAPGASDPIPAEASEPIERRRGRADTHTVALYTCVRWDPDRGVYRLHQELEGKRVEGMAGIYKPDLLPFRVLRYAAIDGEDYGRGMVEELLGDLVSLEGLMRAIVEAAAIASRCVGLVDPAGAATADDLNSAPNGQYVVGRATDVTYPVMNKNGDLQVAFSAVRGIEDRLRQAFLLNSAVQRQAERVTAEEIRFVAQELEAALGGVYSVLSQELQLPLVQLLMDRLQRQGKIKRLPARSVRPAIVTGVEALGRGHEMSRLQIAAQFAQTVIGPEALVQNLNVREFLGRVFTAAGVDTTGLIKKEEEVQQEQQQARMMELTASLGPDVIKQVGPGLVQRAGLAPQGQAQEEAPPPPATPRS